MTNEEKELLLKDLCGRIRYGLKVQVNNIIDYTPTLVGLLGDNLFLQFDYTRPIKNGDSLYNLIEDNIKPYLRPMSSMTEEEVKDLLKVHIRTKYGEDSDYYKNLIRIERISKHHDNSWSAWVVFKGSYNKFASTTCFIIGRVTWETTINEIDWLNKNKFDYRGLISMGLALPVPEGMYNLKVK